MEAQGIKNGVDRDESAATRTRSLKPGVHLLFYFLPSTPYKVNGEVVTLTTGTFGPGPMSHFERS
jgi:hypothetical protein